MLVGERMTPRPITVNEETSLPEALELMRKEKIRRLPVLDKHGKLVGIVTELDLLRASPPGHHAEHIRNPLSPLQSQNARHYDPRGHHGDRGHPH